MNGERVDALVDGVRRSTKYSSLDDAFVRRIAAEAVSRFRGQQDALKYAKRKLHQAVGAYVRATPAAAVERCAAAVAAGEPLRDSCVAAMRAHASTAERIGVLDELFGQVAAWCGEPASVADLACGLNPLAIPWMTLAPGATYWCCDVDGGLAAALERFGATIGVPIVAAAYDLVADPPRVEADVALLLKTLPTLERQAAGATRRVLERLGSPAAVVSTPARTLSGYGGFARDHDAAVQEAVEGSGFAIVDSASVEGEQLHLLERSA